MAREGDRLRAREALQPAVEFLGDEGGVRAVHEADVALRRMLRDQDVLAHRSGDVGAVAEPPQPPRQ